MTNEENNNEEMNEEGGIGNQDPIPTPQPGESYEDWVERWREYWDDEAEDQAFLLSIPNQPDTPTSPSPGLGQRFINPINPNLPPQDIPPPENVAIIERTATTISIAWNNPGNLPNSVFLIRIVHGPNFQLTSDQNTEVALSDTKSTFTITNLQPDTTYYFWMAYETVNQVFGTIVTFSTRTRLQSFGTPAFPHVGVNSQFIVGQNNTVSLSWSPTPSVSGWFVVIEREIIGGPIANRTTIAFVNAGGTWIDSNPPDTELPLRYYLQFFSPTTRSLQRTTTVTPIVVPEPGNAAANPIDHDTIQITWSRPSTIPTGTTLTLYRAVAGNGDFSTASVYQTGLTGTSFTDDNLMPSTQYWYWLVFVLNTREGTRIRRAGTTTSAPGSILANPTSVTSTTIDHDSIRVNWNRPSGLPSNTTARVYRSLSGTFSTATSIASGLSGTEYTNNGLNPSTLYYFWIIFESTSAASSQAIRTSSTTQDAPLSVVPTPTGVTATTLGSTSIRINWILGSGSPSNARATIRSGITDVYDDALVIATNRIGVSFTHTGLTPNVLYYYWVEITAPGLTTSVAVSAQAMTDQINVPTPTGATATAISDTEIRLDWGLPPMGIDGITVYYSTSSTGLPVLGIEPVSLTTISHTFTGLSPSTRYYCYVYYNIGALTGIAAFDDATTAADSTTLTPVTSPTNLTATALDHDSIRINWNRPSGLPSGTTARIWRSTASAFSSAASIASNLSGTQYTDNGLLTDTTYFYWVQFQATGFLDSTRVSTSARTQQEALPMVPSPLNVSTDVIDNDSIRINWTVPAAAPSGTTARIWRNTQNNFSTAISVASGVIGSAYVNNGLSANTLYYFWVELESSSIPDSNPVVTSGTTTAPPIVTVPSPTNVGLLVLDHDSIRINWTRPPALPTGTTARIWQSLSSSFSSANTVTSGLSGTSYTVNGLNSNTFYYFWVELEANGATDSNPIRVSGRTHNQPVSTIPNPTGVSTTVLSTTSIRVNWTRPSGLPSGTTARIWQSTSASFSNANSIRSGLTGSSTTITGLNQDTLYYFWVELESSSATDSNPIRTSGRTQAAATPTPAIPTNVSATSLGETSIRIDWNRPSGLPSTARATIRRQVGGSGTFSSSTVIISNLSGTSYTDTLLTANTQYWYWVLFIDNGVQGGNVRVTATTDAPSSITIPTPTNVSATVLGETSIRVNWTRPSGIPSGATATIRRGTTTTFSQSIVVSSGLTGITFTNTGLSAGTTYYYWVFFTDGTNSGSSIRVSATTSSSVSIPTPPQPDDLRVTNRGTTSIQVQWDEPSGLRIGARATVRFGTTNNFASSTTAITGTSNTTFLISGLQSSTTYYIWVFYQEVNTAGTSAMISTSTRSITVIPVGLTAPNNAWGFDTRPSIASLTEPSQANVWYDGWPDNENNETIYQSQRRIKGTPNVGATMNADGTPFGDWDQPVRIRGPVSTATSAYTIIADPAVSFVSNGNTTTVTVSVTGPETASIVYTFMGTVNGILLQANPVQTGAGHFAHTINTGVSTRMSVVYSASAGSATLASTTFRVDLFRTVQSGGTIRVEIGNQQIDLGVSTG